MSRAVTFVCLVLASTRLLQEQNGLCVDLSDDPRLLSVTSHEGRRSGLVSCQKGEVMLTHVSIGCFFSSDNAEPVIPIRTGGHINKNSVTIYSNTASLQMIY